MAGDAQNEARVRKSRKVVSVENVQTLASAEAFKQQKARGDVQNEARVRKRRNVVSVANVQTLANVEKRSRDRKRQETSRMKHECENIQK